MKQFIIFITVVLSLMLAAPLWATDLGAGLSAFDRGDYTAALRMWRPLAEQGDVAAQHNVGVMQSQGRAVPQDHVEAAIWYRKAAEQGYALSQYNLGLMYDKGQGVPRDYSKAVKWLQKAAAQFHAKSRYHLGFMYDEGHGARDYDKAVKWYGKAAEQGHAIAQLNLGVMYGMGHGVLPDNVLAHMWFSLAAAQGNEKGAHNRSLVANHMTVAEILKARLRARAWIEKFEARQK